MRLILLRHAQTVEGTLNATIGQSPGTLSEFGVRQCAALRERLLSIEIDVAYVSDLHRATITADLVLQPHIVQHRTAALRERHWGDYEGMVDGYEKFLRECEKKRLDPYRERPAGGGESGAELAARVIEYYDYVMKDRASSVLVLSHLGPLSLLLKRFVHHDIRLACCSITVLDASKESVQIVALNDQTHLQGL